MSHYSQYNIANVRIAFRSNIALSVPNELGLFTDQKSTQADFTYDCFMQNELPDIRMNGNVKYYFDQIKERNYAVTEETDRKMTVYLSQENLPWGNEIQQLYTQLALPHVLLLHRKILLHAAYILTSEGAILFTAPSGTGKSTQAELWKKYRSAEIINGDRAVIGLENGVPTAYGYPISGSSEYCQNVAGKLRAIVSLKQAPFNAVRLLGGAESLFVLINRSFLPAEYASDLPLVIDSAAPICEKVPILELSCRPDEGAVDTLYDALNGLTK